MGKRFTNGLGGGSSFGSGVLQPIENHAQLGIRELAYNYGKKACEWKFASGCLMQLQMGAKDQKENLLPLLQMACGLKDGSGCAIAGY